MKRFLTICVVLFFNYIVLPQNYSVTGIALDSADFRPLIGANAVLTTTNKVLAGGASTDLKGKFTIKGIKNGSYILKISYVGYKTYRKKIEVTKGGS